MKTIIRKLDFGEGGRYISHGWGNGYVLIPKGHKYHGVHYDNIPVDVHGGLTFGEEVDDRLIAIWGNILNSSDIGTWCVGFDTGHLGDNSKNWTKKSVQKETESLANQLEELS
jgi:hypothetical protein